MMAQTATDANRTIERIASTIGELPSSPAIVSAVMGLTSNLDADVSDISRVMATDQSLTAKVLKLSNSSFYGRSRAVDSLEEAIMLLGFYSVRSLVVATSTYSMFETKGDKGPELKLWRHSLSTAIAARQIAAAVGHPGRDEIFVAALLHDIGKLVLLKKTTADFLQVIVEVEATTGSFTEVENSRFGFTHCEVAELLLEEWSFPVAMIEAIRDHHSPPPGDPEEAVPLAQMISLGNMLAKRLGVGFADRQVPDLHQTEAAQLLSLDQSALERLEQEVAEYFESETRIFEGA
jgi:putative nucleotidyltransferase with HDIG domain